MSKESGLNTISSKLFVNPAGSGSFTCSTWRLLARFSLQVCFYYSIVQVWKIWEDFKIL